MALNLETLLGKGRVAVLLSEVQRCIIGDVARLGPLADAAREVGVISHSARLAQTAREHQAPVVHCLANTTPGRFGANTNARLFMMGAKGEARPPHDPAGDQPCPEVWHSGDVLSPRDHGLNPMADSQLNHRLRNHGITTLILAGVSVNVAIINLTMDAVNQSYQVIVARDAVAGVPSDYAQLVIKNTLSLLATIATTDDIITAWSKT